MSHIYKFFLKISIFAFIISAGAFFLPGEAGAVAPPLDPGKPAPRNLFLSGGGANNYGAMVLPSASASNGTLRAMGGGVGTTLAEYLKTNKNASLIVIPVEFSDVKMSASGLSAIRLMAEEMCRFFNSQSGGRISLTASTAPRVYKLNNTMGYYGLSDDAESLVRDAVAQSDAEIDFSNYQCVMVAHAGYGDETNPSDNGTSDIWSKYWYSGGYNAIVTGDGVSVNGATVVPELEYEGVSPLGIICHEFGHQLGLPDLYDTSYSTEGGIGRWSLMATGAYNGTPRGSKPALLDPWCRKRLGWVSYEKLSGDYKDFNFESNRVYQLAADGLEPPADYFLLEKRGKAAGTYDEGLPGEGLLIYHVNAVTERENSLSPNNYTPGLIWLVCANAKDHLTVNPRSKVRGLDTDPYPAASNDEFYAYSSPASKTWKGNDSGAAVRNIKRISGGASLMITADIYSGQGAPKFFRTGSFLTPGVPGGIVLTAKPSAQISGKLNAHITDSAFTSSEVTLTPAAGGKYYYALLRSSAKPTRLTLTLTGVRASDSQQVSEEHTFYY
jgi:M6 family metalloprotease-like protein